MRDKGEEAIGCVTTVGSIKPVFKMNVGTDHLWISGALDMRLCEVNDDHGKGLVGAIESGESRGEVVVDGGKPTNDGGIIAEYVVELWYDCAKLRLVFDEAFGHRSELVIIPRFILTIHIASHFVKADEKTPIFNASELS